MPTVVGVQKLYLVQLGSDYANYEGQAVFNLKEAESLYDSLSQSLQDVLMNGSQDEIRDAKIIVNNFRIVEFQHH